MRYRPMIMGMVIVATAAAAPFAAKAAPAKDWLVTSMKVSATGGSHHVGTGRGGGFFFLGPPGSSNQPSLMVVGFGHATGAGPLVVGSGFSADGHGRVFAFDLRSGGVHVRTSGSLGAMDIRIAPYDNGLFLVVSGISSRLRAKQLSALVFVANGVIDQFSIDDTKGLMPTYSTGSGSRTVDVAGRGTSGVAVDASVVAAGASTTTRKAASGLAGSLVWGCTRCKSTWNAPDGKGGSITETRPPGAFVFLPIPQPIPPWSGGSGDPSFAGPAGKWKWSWTGLNVPMGYRVVPPLLLAPNPEPSVTVVAAYAPVGNWWRIFR